MNKFESLITTVAPVWAAKRARAHDMVAAYEAARQTRTHKAKKSKGSGEVVARVSGRSLREQARDLDENHDLAAGVLNTLETRCIGANGIAVQPQIKRIGGGLHNEFIKELLKRRKNWDKRPDVSGQYKWPQLERLAFRTWLRDGELLSLIHAGNIAGLNHGTQTQMSLEMLEIDFLADDIDLSGGIEINAWGQPTRYRLYKGHPGGQLPVRETKWVSASQLLHPRIVKRFHQYRGISIFAAVMIRLADIKDYEESERVAARVAARLAAYIKKGDPQSYVAPERDESGNPTSSHRQLEIANGMIFDDLLPGEEVGVIESSRPSVLLQPFRDAMQRAVSAGTRAGYSSTSKNYNGTYSSQRQELVENMDEYGVIANDFIGQFSQPVHEWFVLTSISSGLKVPADVDLDTLLDADFLVPPMPWINPVHEIKAKTDEIRAGLCSRSKHIRASGQNPDDVIDEIDREREEDNKRGLVFDSDAANDKAPASIGNTPAEEDTKAPDHEQPDQEVTPKK
ncbi:phage portal protein [Permianibacter sp. IMCC34836]|uniref:phage portal protein n=1 Tax=Permianibacter fluminis TaxID=2738515 RepID=UPI0015549C7A|nr:phage portal protein [Permianibacter fluminis]NQD37467.1 phage portal protein [Permianibacter fluminis]